MRPSSPHAIFHKYQAYPFRVASSDKSNTATAIRVPTEKYPSDATAHPTTSLRGGWQQHEFVLYGKRVTKTYKTFLATYPVVGGTIRVVLVREDSTWAAFFCTNPHASVADILTAAADRAAIEQDFHDVKAVHGAGQQQVRHVFANLAVFNLNLWLHALIELWAWDQPAKKLRDRRASPWDDPDRRPSHADRRNALRRASIHETLSATTALRALSRRSRAGLVRLVKLVA